MATLSNKLGRLYNFTPGQWPRLASAALLLLLFTAGIEFGRIGKDSYFITKAGADKIPFMYLGMAGLMVLFSLAYGRIVDRVRRDHLMVGMQLCGGAAMLAVWLVLQFLPDAFPWLPYALYCVVESFLWFLLIHYWTFVNDIFDAREGKTLFPLIGGVGLLGTITGGLCTKLISSTLGANTLFLAWACILLGAIPLVLYLRRLAAAAGFHQAQGKDADAGEAEPALPSAKESPLAVFRRIWSQPMLRTLTYMAFPLWIVLFVIEYTYYTTMDRVFPDQDQLAGFFGLFVSIASFSGLLLQFSFTPWLLRKVGVGSASITYPLTLTMGTIALLVFTLFPDSLAARISLSGVALLVVFARWCDVAIYYSVYESATQLLFYAVPADIRGRGRNFISGLVMPLGMASAGGLLLFFRHTAEPLHNIAFMAITLGFLLIILALNLAPDYLKALLTGPGVEVDEEYRHEVMREVSTLEQSDIRYVFIDCVVSPDETEATYAVGKLFESKDEELIEDLEDLLPRMTPAARRAVTERMTPEELERHPVFLRPSAQSGSIRRPKP